MCVCAPITMLRSVASRLGSMMRVGEAVAEERMAAMAESGLRRGARSQDDAERSEHEFRDFSAERSERRPSQQGLRREAAEEEGSKTVEEKIEAAVEEGELPAWALKEVRSPGRRMGRWRARWEGRRPGTGMLILANGWWNVGSRQNGAHAGRHPRHPHLPLICSLAIVGCPSPPVYHLYHYEYSIECLFASHRSAAPVPSLHPHTAQFHSVAPRRRRFAMSHASLTRQTAARNMSTDARVQATAAQPRAVAPGLPEC